MTGCDQINPGCDLCYAKSLAERFRGTEGHYYENGFDLTLRPNKLDEPSRNEKPTVYFVNSMSDLFHKDIPLPYLDQVFDVMDLNDQHLFQPLTKRSSRMMKYLNDRYGNNGVPGHIWVGVSVEDARHVSRIKHLQATNAAVRFVSAEPLLGSLG